MSKKKEYKFVFVPARTEPLTEKEIKETKKKHRQVLIELMKIIPNE